MAIEMMKVPPQECIDCEVDYKMLEVDPSDRCYEMFDTVHLYRLPGGDDCKVRKARAKAVDLCVHCEQHRENAFIFCQSWLRSEVCSKDCKILREIHRVNYGDGWSASDRIFRTRLHIYE